VSSAPEAVEAAAELCRAGRLDEAERLCRGVLAGDPLNARAVNLLGAIAHRGGDLAGAAERFAEAARFDPGLAAAHANLASALLALGRPEEAAASFERALAVEPDALDTRLALGTTQGDLGRWAEAAVQFERVLAAEPGHVEARLSLGSAQQRLGRLEEAAQGLHQLAERCPDLAAAHNMLGHVLRRLGRLVDSETALARALALDPGFAKAHANLGALRRDQGCLEEAVRHYRRVLELDPTYSEGHYKLALALLQNGDWAAGWDGYEWRWGNAELPQVPRAFPQPLWDGGPLAGKTILLWGEQGIGDEIMFASLVPEVAAASRCVLECERRLVPLFARSFPTVEAIARGDPPHARTAAPDVTAQSPTGSLARWLRRHREDFPARPGYLKADAGWAAQLRASYGPGPVVGLSWHTTNPLSGAQRSIPLAQWDRVLAVPGAVFVDLQYGDWRAALDDIRERLGVAIRYDPRIDPMNDFDGFAAQVAAMDLVITIDNSTAHLAGALGRPVWTLLPFAAEWRWGTAASDTPWYPTMRLFRQRRPGDWAPVLAAVAAALARLA